ncbi:ABC transporter permease [Lysinibacter cavernae]|uniref:Simple sugar transport system permease protein n=1 Tax=Lysinibacter cavernae TaxID=1640652 RepID=A0A7X5TTL9_9MICO|nr:ABC transporter permease [Lysinibacter cavernae]NIH54771.1 simple sugar transport system permease protein [Lysinibacter cavernae]
MDLFDAFLSSGVRLTTPILLAALACLPTQWTKDLNIGLEGAMLFGAFGGVVFGLMFQSVALGIAATVIAGIISGLIFGYVITRLNVNVFVAGIALNIFAAAATVYLLRSFFGVKGTLSDPGIPSLPVYNIPFIKDIPVIGAIVSGHTILTYLSWVLVAVMVFAVRRTVLVRRLKAAGEHPAALAAAGGNVNRMRVWAQVWCFALCALAGAQLSVGQLTLFTEGMTNGLGFVALAAVIFCRGKVKWLAVMSVIFGLASAVAVQVNDAVVAPQFAQMLPYVIAFIGLIVLAKTSKDGGIRIATPTMEA